MEELSSSPINAIAVTGSSRAAINQGAEEDKLLGTLKDIRQLLQKDSQKEHAKPLFTWIDLQPPGYGETFHPEWYLQSLDDTPDHFSQEQIGKVNLSSDVQRYLKDKPSDVEQHLEARPSDEESQQVFGMILHKNVEAADTFFLSVFDISQSRDGLDFDISTSISPFKILLDGNIPREDPVASKLTAMAGNDKEKDVNDDTPAANLWLALLSDQLEDCKDFKALSPEDQQIFRKSTFRGDRYSKVLLHHLSDSVSVRIFTGRSRLTLC